MSGLNKQDVNVPDVSVRGAGRWRVPVAVLALVALAVGAGSAVLTHRTAAQPAAPPMQAAPAVPVTVATAVRQDYPVYLSGLGTVQAFYAVQLRPQVDGTLLQVPVAEGQEVKQGDLLAVIDPRPYQAVLDAASAKKQQDQADLANAKRDMERYTSLAKQDFASHQQVDTQVALVNHLVAQATKPGARHKHRHGPGRHRRRAGHPVGRMAPDGVVYAELLVRASRR